MDLDTMLTEAAPARHVPLDGPDSPAAVRLYQQITAQPPPCRPSRRRRYLLSALIGVGAATVAAVVALALMPGSPAAPGHRGGQGGTTLAAWSVVRERHGLVRVTIRELRDPAGLQQMLRAAGVPSNVRFLHHNFMATTSTHDLPAGCLNPPMSDEANALLQEKIMPLYPLPLKDVAINIRPKAIPDGIGLYLKAWAASPGTHNGPYLTLQADLVQASPGAPASPPCSTSGGSERPPAFGGRCLSLVGVREIAVFSGSAHPKLSAEICAELAEPLLPVRLRRFANDCLEVQLQSNCRERDVFLIQPLSPPVQEHLVELLLMLDAARGASAARVTAVIPHYAYARSDKKHMPRVSIGARMVADLLVSAGANRVLTMTLHSSQVHGFFSVPVDHLHALRELASHFRDQDLSETVVVSPDLGNAKSAAAFAARLGLPVAAGAKERIDDHTVSITSIIGDVDDRHVIALDDEIARGTTLLELLAKLREHRVRSVRVACTHGLFADGALDKIAAAPEVREIVCTNTVPPPDPGDSGKLTVLSVAPALAEAIRRIHVGESVSALFGQH